MLPFQMPHLHVIPKKTVLKYIMSQEHIILRYSYSEEQKVLLPGKKQDIQRNDVFAELTDYTINITKSSFTIDSAKLTHKTYFKEPVLGTLTDQAIKFQQ